MNEERIRNWHERRMAAVVEAVPAPTAFEEPGPAPFGPEPGKPGSAVERLELARAAILERRNGQWRRTMRRLGMFVAAPIAAVALYASLFATPLYDGEAVFTVQTSASSAAAPMPVARRR